MKQKAFTLAELLLALVILGVIATFTIPKVLSAQSDNKQKAMAKEVASMISGAYTAYRQSNTQNAMTNGLHLTPYMNYVKVDTTSMADLAPGQVGTQCSNTEQCLRLHNGGMLVAFGDDCFYGTSALNGIYYVFDPNASQYLGNAADAPGKSVDFFLYANGRLVSGAGIAGGTVDDWNCNSNPDPEAPSIDPSWFAWN